MNTLLALGQHVSERTIRRLARTSWEGTTQDGIKAALLSFGLTVLDYSGDASQHAWAWLRGSLTSGRPVILCVDNWEHWVTTVGILDARVVLVDSTNDAANVQENGVHVLSARQLLRRWRCGAKAKDVTCRYYGISAGKS